MRPVLACDTNRLGIWHRIIAETLSICHLSIMYQYAMTPSRVLHGAESETNFLNLCHLHFFERPTGTNGQTVNFLPRLI